MTLRRMLGLAGPFRTRLLLATGAGLLGAALLGLLAPLTGVVVDRAVQGDRAGVLAGGGAATALVLGHLGALWLSQWWFADISAALGRRMRDDLSARVGQAPLQVVESQDADDLLARGGHEIDEVAEFVTAQLPALLVASGYLVTSLVVLLGHSVALTLALVLVYVPVAAVVLGAFRRRARGAFAREAERVAALAGLVAEGASLADDLRHPVSSRWWQGEVSRANARLLSAIRATVRALNTFPLLLVVEALAVAAVLLLGSALVRAGEIGVPTVAVFLVASGTLFALFAQLGDALAALASARAQAWRHFEVVDALTSGEAAYGTSTATGPAELVVSDLHFAYPGRHEVLRGVDLRLPAGSRTVVVGPSGAGKSTLAKLLAGLYSPASGSVSIAGVDAAHARTPLGERAALLVTQEAAALPGTVRDNLLLPEHLSDEAVMQTASALGLTEWLTDLGGLGRELTPGSLDAADTQRLSLLRAAIRRPEVLVLDESTASLAEQPGEELYERLEELLDATIVVVAHHRRTIDRYSRVVTVDQHGVTSTEATAGP